MYPKKNKQERPNRCSLLALFCSILLVFSGIFLTDALAERGSSAEWTPDSYEIHLLLNSDLVLNDSHQLKEEILRLFHADDDYKTFSLAYYDTLEQDFYKEGWINRIRLKYEKNDENDFKLTYKKRYPVPGGDVIAAVQLAASEGFDLTGNRWEPQIEWGYTGMTLSLSAETAIPADTEETIADLDPSESFAMMAENMPAEEVNWRAEHWGIRALESAEQAGPIFFNRYKGEFHGRKVTIEVWEIHDERDSSIYFLSELSFKAGQYEEAADSRKQMMDSLLDLGILLKVDSLKTRQLLDAYLVSPE